jgi:Dolichyl-phosphate-mannose-protein mannosyltransferase
MLTAMRSNPATPRSLFPMAWVVALVAGCWLRIDQLSLQVLIEDEWHPVHQVIYLSPERIMLSFGNADYSIPLVLLYFLEHRLIGLSELGLRLPMVLAGIATVAVLPLMVRRRVGDAVASTFALLLALSPLLVSYSRIARGYAITLLGVYLAFWCLERAIRGASLGWKHASCYSAVCGLVVWTHAITGPMLVAPLIALWWAALRGRGLAWESLLALTALTGACMALAVLPPLLGDPQALLGKAGMDRIGKETIVGAWYLWLGSGSTAVAWGALALAAIGMRGVWAASPTARWVLLGSVITTAVLLVTKPWWVDRSPAFARYLLPIVPVILLSVSAGLVASADAAAELANAPQSLRTFAAVVAIAACLALWWPASPWGEILHFPNSYTEHSYFQYDYRKDRNPIRSGQAEYPSSPFWAGLAARPPGSLTIAVAPFRYSTYKWPAPIWERESRQRVIPAYLWGTCVDHRFGEVPPGRSFHFRNAVHVVDAWSGFAQRIDYLAYYRGPQWINGSLPARACEDWMRKRLGAPFFEDGALVVWKNPLASSGP